MSELDLKASSEVAGRPEWVSPELFPYESRFLDLEGCRLHYIDEGEGPVLLLLHGNPTWSFLYRRMVARLRDRFRCVALDYPGFGLSSAPPGYGFTPAEPSSSPTPSPGRSTVNGISSGSPGSWGEEWGGSRSGE